MKQLLKSDLHAIAPITRHEKCSNIIYYLHFSVFRFFSLRPKTKTDRGSRTRWIKTPPKTQRKKNKITNIQEILFFSFLDGGGGVVSVLTHRYPRCYKKNVVYNIMRLYNIVPRVLYSRLLLKNKKLKSWPQANVRLITLYTPESLSTYVSSSSSSIQSHWEITFFFPPVCLSFFFFQKIAQQLMARSGVQMIFDGSRRSSKVHSHHSRRFFTDTIRNKNRYKLTLCSQFCLVSFLHGKKKQTPRF